MLITVTGATGRTGRHVVTGLLAAGHAVRGLVRSDTQAAELGAAGAVPVLGDLTSSDLAAFLKGSDALLHAAAASNPAPGASDAVDRIAAVCVACLTESTTEHRAFDLTSGDQPVLPALRALAPR